MTADVWTTGMHRAAERFEAWREALNQSHLEWDLEPPGLPTFNARVRQKWLDGIRVVDCRCDPCVGWRRRSLVRRTEGAYLGILFELRGREVIRQGDNEAVLETGDFVMWDSEREMEFRVLEPLHKLTLLIPKARMSALLGDVEQYAGMVVRGSGKADGIAAEALRRLARDFVTIDESSANMVMDPILDLLAATLRTRRVPADASKGHTDSFRRFCRYIETNLGDATLSPSKVATAHNVSLRYLHLVFAEQSTSVGQWIRRRRLQNCRRELSWGGRSRSITEIAFHWGFNDMSHFSRTFKAQFGASPRELARVNQRGV
jgi:AraC family transcriptional regulator, positive regulator of tynA and feaB